MTLFGFEKFVTRFLYDFWEDAHHFLILQCGIWCSDTPYYTPRFCEGDENQAEVHSALPTQLQVLILLVYAVLC